MMLNYTLFETANVTIKIFNYPANLLLEKSWSSQTGQSGDTVYTRVWDGCDRMGYTLPTGGYIAVVTAHSQSSGRVERVSTKLALIRKKH
jgi:hypothetical protein